VVSILNLILISFFSFNCILILTLSCSSQIVPEKKTPQVQLNDPSVSMQVPPFMQGFGIQATMCRKQRDTLHVYTKYTLTLGYSKYKVALSIKIYGNYRNKIIIEVG